MGYRLPSLNALRAFEASARHLSFSLAADELHVTQSAVSRHIRTLEEYLGFPLFHRLHRSLSLTERGAALLPDLSTAFDRMSGAVARVMEDRRDLRVKTPPTFAIRWLIPRLVEFQTRHQEIEVRLTTGSNADFRKEEFDVAVWCAREAPPHLNSELVLTEVLTPVCSAAYLEAHRIEKPEDLACCTLIHPATDREDWRHWLQRVGLLEEFNLEQGLAFTTLEMAVSAAMQGLGVTVADYGFVRGDIEAGRLAMPLDIRLTSCFNYYIVWPDTADGHGPVQNFRKWIVDASAAQRAEVDAFRETYSAELDRVAAAS
jgi:LysR family glycine cleavage system transcriptional activator